MNTSMASQVNSERAGSEIRSRFNRVQPAGGGRTIVAKFGGTSLADGAQFQKIREIVESARRRELVFADRFPFLYFVREYGLDYLAAFPSCTADTEPSAQIVMSLIKRVAEDHIPAVYTIELSTQAIAKTVAEETGAEILTMQSMQTVSQADFDAGENYVSIMKQNIEALRKGLN